ncbi:MAG: 16S rRNA (guanine(527)-N(7))-methyltransferase RsmG [Desulfobacterales bacterium]|nr:MAG: 16S rRNA (guanine(527)-N(7))-methyltransferase RsmG [Desulfobacterales bacterium]
MEVGSTQWEDLIIDGAKELGIEVDRQHAHQFAIHGIELIKWNKKINLTTITDPQEVALKHFLDSIAPVRWIPPSSSLLDIGSGGGFPGIPLKVVIPSLSVTLIDGSRKKISFLKHIIRILRLKDIDARQIRAEELVKDANFAPVFDVIVGRAISSLESLVRMASLLLAEEGIIIAFKGDVDQKEVNALRLNTLDKVDSATFDHTQYSLALEIYKLPFIQSKRSMLILRQS